MKSYPRFELYSQVVVEEEGTHEKPLRLRLHIQKNQRKPNRQANPEYNQPKHQPHKRTNRRQIPKRLAPQEPRKRILLHSLKTIILLRMEHIRNLRQSVLLRRAFGFVGRREREGVDAERGREVDLVVFGVGGGGVEVGGGAEVAEVDAFGGRDEVLSGYGGGAGDDGWGAGGAFGEEGRPAGEGEGRGGAWGVVL